MALVVKNLPANVGDVRDMGSIPGWRRFPVKGSSSYPLQYFCLENSMDRGAWWATVHGATKSDVAERLKTTIPYTHIPYQNRKEVVPCLGHLRSVLCLLGGGGERLVLTNNNG